MICNNCGFDNKEENEVCEACQTPLFEKEEKERSLLDRLVILSIFTFLLVAFLSVILLVILFFFK